VLSRFVEGRAEEEGKAGRRGGCGGEEIQSRTVEERNELNKSQGRQRLGNFRQTAERKGKRGESLKKGYLSMDVDRSAQKKRGRPGIGELRMPSAFWGPGKKGGNLKTNSFRGGKEQVGVETLQSMTAQEPREQGCYLTLKKEQAGEGSNRFGSQVIDDTC